jgi:DNA-binding beta-propeller fold protein YncE
MMTKRVRTFTMAAALLAPMLAMLALPSAGRAQTFHVLHKYDIGGEGFFDYLNVDPATNRVYVTRGTHVMVVDGATGKVVGNIPNTPGVHGVAFAPKHDRGFITDGGDSTVTMFNMKTLAVEGRIDTHTPGLDGIAYDDATDRIFTMDHSRDPGSSVAIDAATGKVVGKVMLAGAPEGAVANGKGMLYINIEDKSVIQVVDTKTLEVIASWPLAPGEGPSGLALDRETNRLFSACHNGWTVVVDAMSGKVVAQIPIGPGPDAIGWDPSEKLIYTPGGGSFGRGREGASAAPSTGTITIAHEDSPNKYTVVATVETMRGARTLAVDPTRHLAYTFTPEFGPAPANAQQPPAGGRRRFVRGPIKASWLFVVGK